MAGPQSAQQVLQDPRVDVAVLETARGGVLRRGLGFDACNVGVVTNVTSDHLGRKGINSLADLARVTGVVPRSVFRDGTSVLNADNVWTARMAEDARGEGIFFSMDDESDVVQDHLRQQGRALVLRRVADGEMLTLLEPHQEVSIMLAGEIPATMGGYVRCNNENALAAAAAALGAGANGEQVRAALSGFSTDHAQTPGRIFDRIVIREDSDRRGRAPGRDRGLAATRHRVVRRPSRPGQRCPRRAGCHVCGHRDGGAGRPGGRACRQHRRRLGRAPIRGCPGHGSGVRGNSRRTGDAGSG